MYEWQAQIQRIVNEIDDCIKTHDDEALTLQHLSEKSGYSEFYITRKFREISGMQFRDYLRCRRMAFAMKEVRDSERGILDIALDYGFSSQEAFSRAFKALYGAAPAEYRKNPVPVTLRTKLNTFDRYFLGLGEIGMVKSTEDVKVYFVTIPAHKFLFAKNYDSVGYWDFWQKQSLIPGHDCATICGLLDSIKDKLDDEGGSEPNAGAGQIMAFISDPRGRTCSWGFPLAECYGVRLSENYSADVPPQFELIDVPENEYVVFEHGPFDYGQENCSVEEKIEKAMAEFAASDTGYCFDTAVGSVFYFYHDPARFWKYVRPVKKTQ